MPCGGEITLRNNNNKNEYQIIFHCSQKKFSQLDFIRIYMTQLIFYLFSSLLMPYLPCLLPWLSHVEIFFFLRIVKYDLINILLLLLLRIISQPPGPRLSFIFESPLSVYKTLLTPFSWSRHKISPWQVSCTHQTSTFCLNTKKEELLSLLSSLLILRL